MAPIFNLKKEKNDSNIIEAGLILYKRISFQAKSDTRGFINKQACVN